MKDSDNYQTDIWLKKIFENWFDPCPFLNCEEELWENGLWVDWMDKGGRAFVNPPFSEMPAWVEKCILEHKKGCTIVGICKHDSSTAWWRRLNEAGARFMFFHGRLRYRTGTAPAWPSAMFILSRDEE